MHSDYLTTSPSPACTACLPWPKSPKLACPVWPTLRWTDETTQTQISSWTVSPQAIDVWTGFCVLTAFLSLMGVMAVNWCLPSPDEVKCQLSAVNCHLSNVSCQLASVNCQLSTVYSKMSAYNYPPSTFSCQLSAVNCHLVPFTCQLSSVKCQLSIVK